MELEKIGFYTLSNKRALNSSVTSPLYRCELILTDECNFKCPYCRPLRDDIKGELDFNCAMNTLKLWCKDGLKNVRFSGGEPTLYPGLDLLAKYCKKHGVERIAISTNGSANIDYYKYLIQCGANDFSISLDGGCCSVGDKMSGIPGSWNTVVDAVKEISKLTYVSVGIVFTEDNILEVQNTVEMADSLGVSDIRVIPSAQYNETLHILSKLSDEFIERFPILKYRIENLKNKKHVRGIKGDDQTKCRLVLDDMAVAGNYHFPCIIYMREGGDPIGLVGEGMRYEREEWMNNHIPCKDKICSEMCLDVCIEFNKIASSKR